MSGRGISELLPDGVLKRIRARAPGYDRENSFCLSDIEELAETGYLRGPVPPELGGSGLSIAETTLAQRRLAEHSPATALAVNMHLLWVTVARLLYDSGDNRLRWILRDAAAGELFAFGISETENDSILLDSFCSAEPDGSGGYRISGKKIFTTLSPVWTRIGVHARDNSNRDDPKLVYGFIRREAIPELPVRTQEHGGDGISYPDAWNPLGMRATQSWNTQLDGARLLAEDVTAVIEPFDPKDPLISAISPAFSVLTSSVYAGIADRALDIAIESANTASGDGIRLDDPDLAAKLTDAVVDHRGSIDALELLATDLDAGVDRDDWSVALAVLKNRVTDEARRTVDTAMRVVGSRAYDADSELSRIYRDVLAGLFHPRSSRSLAASIRESLQR